MVLDGGLTKSKYKMYCIVPSEIWRVEGFRQGSDKKYILYCTEESRVFDRVLTKSIYCIVPSES